MVHKAVAQRDVGYLNELLSKETDENRRTILLRLLADAEDAAGGRARGEKRLRRANANGDRQRYSRHIDDPSIFDGMLREVRRFFHEQPKPPRSP